MSEPIETTVATIYEVYVDKTRNIYKVEVDPLAIPEPYLKDLERKKCLIRIAILKGYVELDKLKNELSRHGLKILNIRQYEVDRVQLIDVYVKNLQIPIIYLLPSILIGLGLLIFAIAVLVFLFKVPGEWIAITVLALGLPLSIAFGYAIIKFIMSRFR